MSDRIVQDDNEITMILSVMLRKMLVDKMGPERSQSEYDSFAYSMTMNNKVTGEDETFLVSFDDDNRYMVECIDPGTYPENCLLFFSEDKESAILNAALYGDGFVIKEEWSDEEPDLE